MKSKLAALIEVRKLVMLYFALIFGVLVFIDKIPIEYSVSVFLMVFGYYFAKSTALDNPNNNKNKENDK